MRRRKLVALVSAVTLLAIVFIAIAVIGIGVGTNPGRDLIRSTIQKQLEGQVNGKIHLGKAGGGLLRGFTLDSFAILDHQDSILVSTGKVSLDYDPRDLIDRRLLLRNITVERPVIRLRQHANGDWNFERIFRTGGPRGPNVPGRSFGDFIVLDSVRVRNGEFTVTRPWEPDDTLSGAKRDSAIRRNLQNPNRIIRRSAEGLTHTYRWTRINAFLPHVRLAHPDSNRFGREFHIAQLDVEEFEPPFSFRNGRGVVRQQGDSIFLDVAHFDLPASTGSAKGRVWWGSKLPIRVDVRVVGDSVSLNDVAWVYETLPRTGVGRTKLRIRNVPGDLRHFQYELTDMDVRSTRSRLIGGMTFVTGQPVLEVTDVDLRAAPVNFDLVRTLAGGPLSVDWQGDLFGHVKGPGGPLTDFVVDESDVTWQDGHVRGAVSRGSGRGALDILDPELTKFKAFDLNVASLDMRSIEFLFPEFPRLGGTVAGTTRLDSLWLDVRFSDANVTHRNGPGEPTRVTGSGRVTWAEDFMRYDLAVVAQPVSLTMLSRAYPLHLKGLMSGPIRAVGTTNDLLVRADLAGPAGRITYDGRVDAYPLSVAAYGSGRVDSLRFDALVDAANAPVGSLTGPYELRVRADTSDLGTLQGSAALFVERGDFDGLRVFPSRIHATFADRRVRLDSLRLESVAATITAAGSLGLAERTADSVRFEIAVDSLGGLRRYVTRMTAALTDTGVSRDSLAGSLRVTGVVSGSLRAPDVRGRVAGSNVFVRREAGREVEGAFDLRDVFNAPTGSASVRIDAMNVGGIALDTLGATVRLDAGRTGQFRVGALARNGVTLDVGGDLALNDVRNEIVLRQVALRTDSSEWMLRAPANIYTSRGSFAVDSLVVVRNRGGGYVRLSGTVPESGPARVLFRAERVPLYDVGRIAQLGAPLSGAANLTLQGAGTLEAPVMNLQATLEDIRYGGLRAQRVRALAEYRNRRAEVSIDLARGERTALFARGSLPMELRYFGARLLDDSLRGSIRTDSASFDIVEALVPGARDATGTLVANLDIGGTWSHPDIAGALRVENGEVTLTELGVRVRGVEVDLGLFGHSDSLAVRRIAGWTDSPADSASVQGYIAYRDITNPYFDLRLAMRRFLAVDRRSLARLNVSTEARNPIRLRGQLRGATLTGGLIVDRGDVYLPDPEIMRKRQVDITSSFSDSIVDRPDLLPKPPSRLMESLLLDDVRVTLGDEVWLRSREANIKLVGSLNVQRVRERRLAAGLGLGQDSVQYVPLLEGQLRAERGTYALTAAGAFQREFQVEGGTVTFLPIAGIEPELNISALHTVRTRSSSDLRIRVRLTGPLVNPIVSLESAESFALSQSDLVSYLVFGQPNFELGTSDDQALTLITQQLFLSAPAIAQAQLRSILGSYADFLTVRPAAADASAVALDRSELLAEGANYFLATRVGAERQLSDRLFFSISSGGCWLRSDNDRGTELLNNLSGKIEWRLSRDASVRAGKEPSDESLVCGRGYGRVIRAPSQWGVSLFKTWRF
jgi:translocation and assembly module TamB